MEKTEKDNNWIWIAAIAIILIFIILGFTNIAGYGMRGMMYGNYGYGMMLFGWITWILVIALMIAAIYWLFKSANKK